MDTCIGDIVEDTDQASQVGPSAQQQVPIFYPPQEPIYSPVGNPQPTVVKQDVSTPVAPVFVGVCLVGIIILSLGAMISASVFLSDFDYQESLDARTYGRIGVILGGMLLSMGLLAAGLAAEGLSSRNRSALFISAVIVIAITIIWPYY